MNYCKSFFKSKLAAFCYIQDGIYVRRCIKFAVFPIQISWNGKAFPFVYNFSENAVKKLAF